MLCLFRRELRLVDNTAFIEASRAGPVLPAFIFTPEQVGPGNKYRSLKAIQFMLDSLADLNEELGGRLAVYYGEQSEVVRGILEGSSEIRAVYMNRDYTPYAIERDARIAKVCEEAGVPCYQLEDSLLNPVGSVRTDQGGVYKKFTPYYRKASRLKVAKPRRTHLPKILQGGAPLELGEREGILHRGGRREGLRMLERAVKIAGRYARERDRLDKEGTTELSAFIKFGCLSIREVYWKLRKYPALIRQLYWRDFYYNIFWEFKGEQLQRSRIRWDGKREWLEAWKRGETGVPIVDAGMRQMNATGWMHNRARLIVSNYLVKILRIDWREGEKYFSQRLYDIDRAVNNGNWQWSAGTGADSQPYFRIFNPYLQAKRYDPNAEYIKRWVPELAHLSPREIHSPEASSPIVDYFSRRKIKFI